MVLPSTRLIFASLLFNKHLNRLANICMHFQVNREGQVTKENKEDQQSDTAGEDETEVRKIQTTFFSSKGKKEDHPLL